MKGVWGLEREGERESQYCLANLGFSKTFWLPYSSCYLET